MRRALARHGTFCRATRLGNYRRDVPIEALFAAGITAVRSEDCGPCTQLATAMAERQGVRPEILRAILQDDVVAMPDDAALAWRFTKAILAHDARTADDYRAVILRAMGTADRRDPGLCDHHGAHLSDGEVPPWDTERPCTRVVVGGAPVAIGRELTSMPWGPTNRQSHGIRSA